MRRGGDWAEGKVRAAVELELLQRRAIGRPPAMAMRPPDSAAAEVGEAGGEAPVERVVVVVEEPAGAEQRVSASV